MVVLKNITAKEILETVVEVGGSIYRQRLLMKMYDKGTKYVNNPTIKDAIEECKEKGYVTEIDNEFKEITITEKGIEFLND